MQSGYQSGTNLLILFLAKRERMKWAAAGWLREKDEEDRCSCREDEEKRPLQLHWGTEEAAPLAVARWSSMEEKRRRSSSCLTEEQRQLLLLQASADWAKMATARRRPLLTMARRRPLFLFSHWRPLFLFLADRFLLPHRARAFSTPCVRFFPASSSCAARLPASELRDFHPSSSVFLRFRADRTLPRA